MPEQSNFVPNLFLIGAPKCATTSLANMLAASTDVSFGRSKEPGIFSNADYQAADRSRLLRDHYSAASAVTWRLDATPWLLYDSDAYGRIIEHDIDPTTRASLRFLVSLRDPMGRIHSMYKDQYRRGAERRSFGEAVATSLRAAEASRTTSPLTMDYVRSSCYSTYLAKWRDTLGDGKKLEVVFFESVMEFPDTVASEIGSRLGVDLAAAGHDNTAAEGTAAGTATVDRLARLGGKIPPAVRTPIRRMAVPVSNAVLRRMPKRSVTAPPLTLDDPGLAADLTAALAQERDALANELPHHDLIGSRPSWLDAAG